MILVTGATGMIGARLLYDLVSRGESARAIRRGSGEGVFSIYTREHPELRERVEWVQADLDDIVGLEEALDGVDTVFHSAGMISFDPRTEKEMWVTNVLGTTHLVDLCLAKPGFRYFAHVSSVATLGRHSQSALMDENSHWDPAAHPSRYAVSKYAAEREVWRAIAEGLPAVMVNPSIVLGPGDFSKGSAALFRKVKNGFPFFTDGVSGFVDVRDVSAALLFLYDKQVTGERFILNGENLSFQDLFRQMADNMSVKAPSIRTLPWMSGMLWPLEKLRSIITGKPPFITRETARSAHSHFAYSAQKIEQLGFCFRSVGDCIRHTVPYLSA